MNVFIQGAGPEAIQTAQLMRNKFAMFVSGAVRNGTLAGAASRRTRADILNPPQIFVRRDPAVTQFLRDSAVGIDTAAPHLPGRLPPTAWDGEPGYGAPASVGG